VRSHKFGAAISKLVALDNELELEEEIECGTSINEAKSFIMLVLTRSV
jgi:hypothetical protein